MNAAADTLTTIAAASMVAVHDPAENLRRIEALVDVSAGSGVRLLVLPELSLHGYPRATGTYNAEDTLDERSYYSSVAESIPGPATARIGELARQHGMTIQFGLAERRRRGSNIYNAVAIVGPDGLIGTYRKVHNQNEWPVFASGEAIAVFDTPVGAIGPLICADLHYPELARMLAIQGAEILTMSAAYAGHRENDLDLVAYRVQAEATAMANQVWIVQANQTGGLDEPGQPWYFGISRIVSPFGEVATGVVDEGVVSARVDVRGEIARHVALKGPRLARRRPALYGPLAEPGS